MECSFGVDCCTAGYYSDHTVCTPCPAGTSLKFSRASSSATYIPCDVRRYSAAGSSSCTTACVGTTYISGTKACSPYPSGTYNSPSNSATTVSSCTACPASTFSSSSFSLLQADNCIRCASGSYSATVGASSCQPCPPGSIRIVEDLITCTVCGSGQYAPSASRPCQLCPAGTVSESMIATSNTTGVSCAKGKKEKPRKMDSRFRYEFNNINTPIVSNGVLVLNISS